MRTNKLGVTEVASIRTDQEKYMQEHERILGHGKKQFCDVCDKRLSYCGCPKEEMIDSQEILNNLASDAEKDQLSSVDEKKKRVLVFISEYEALCEKHHLYIGANFTYEEFIVSDIHSPKWDKDSMFKMHLDDLKHLKSWKYE
jgi:hypothetical protein